MKLPPLALTLTLALTSPAWSQAMKCPVCVGPNLALQYTGTACICATISGVVGPAGPPGTTVPASPCPVEGNTERWNGAAWVCYPTKFILGE